jgi:Putative inner membrane protein (DUF1819)
MTTIAESSSTARHYTANISKGSALVPEMVALLREWEPHLSNDEFYARVVESNILGKATRSRARDILSRVFAPRFLTPGCPSVTAMKALVEGATPSLKAGADDLARPSGRVAGRDAVERLVLYHAALTDDLLYDFVADRLMSLRDQGRYQVVTGDAVAYIKALMDDGLIRPRWSESMTERAGQGLLTTCRDTGLLEGAVNKRFAPVYMPFEAFVYVAYTLKDRGVAGSAVVRHRDWRLFLLDHDAVERLFVEADGRRALRYEAVGEVRRIDWAYGSLLEAVHGLGY